MLNILLQLLHNKLYTQHQAVAILTLLLLQGFLACDHGNQQTNLDVSVTDTSANEFFIYKQKNISAHATEELQTNAGIVLQQGEILKAQVNHANIDLYLSIIEYAKGD